MAHGGGATVRNAADTMRAAAARAEGADPASYPGFGYFLGGVPPDGSRTQLGEDLTRARKVLGALSALLPRAEANERLDNERLPSGYTYLLQFLAHDLVNTTVPFWAAADAGVVSRNVRTTGLQLDTFYGGGPSVCPIPFQPDGLQVEDRFRFKLGPVGDADRLKLPEGTCPFRDVARATDPCLADERNDDSIILAQLTALFSILHNTVAWKVRRQEPDAKFGHARVAMLLMYHAVIRHDLMKRLLDDAAYQMLRTRDAASPDWLWPGGDMPLEFTHGAFRVGHAMVRDLYDLNRLRQPFSVADVVNGRRMWGVREALTSDWIVEWARLFELHGKPNYSRKLGPRVSSLDMRDLFQRYDPNGDDAISLRDWLSAATARMCRSDALIAEAAKRYPDVKFLDRAAVGDWLGRLVKQAGTCPEADTVNQHMTVLIDDLPLPLYVLLEAEQMASGRHMGPLGSIIAGEVIFRCLTEQERELQGQVAAARDAIGPAWNRIEAVQTMPDLIKLAAEWASLTDCPALPFIGSSS